MGMSASQARLLSLTQRKSDVEYQGQQINQQRTTLSNQVNALYNSLLEMDVPTPPSTSDYQKIVYSGKLGATEYSFEANEVIPKGGNSYSVTLGRKGYGNTISATTSFSKVEYGTPGSVTGKVFEGNTITVKGEGYKPESYGRVKENTGKEASITYGNVITDLEGAYNSNQIILFETPEGHFFQSPAQTLIERTSDGNGGYTYKKLNDSSVQTLYYQGGPNKLYCMKVDEDEEMNYLVCSPTEMTTMYIKDGTGVRRATTADFDGRTKDGHYILKKGVQYITTAVGDTQFSLKGASNVAVDGNGVFVFEALEAVGVDPETITAYKEAIANSDMLNDQGKNYTWQDFYVILGDGGKSASFVLKSDIEDGNDCCSTYQYEPNGEYTTKEQLEDCKLNFDPTNGRITLIGIPNYDENGEIASYTNIRLESKSVTDEDEFNEAMADYNYEKTRYDQKQQEINRQTEVIQQQDKNLELKLTRLDNERNAINTETDAVKKVIQDNIDKSYKTFSG